MIIELAHRLYMLIEFLVSIASIIELKFEEIVMR